MLNRASEYIYLIPQNTDEKEKQLEEMIKLALVDDDFAPAELELIEMVSDRLGFTRKELEVVWRPIVATRSNCAKWCAIDANCP